MFIQLSSVIALDKGQCEPPGSKLLSYKSLEPLGGELSESVPASNAINDSKRDCFYIFTDSYDYTSLRKASTSSSVFAKMILAPKFISFFSKNS